MVLPIWAGFGANIFGRMCHLYGLIATQLPGEVCQVTRLHFKKAAATATLSAVNCWSQPTSERDSNLVRLALHDRS